MRKGVLLLALGLTIIACDQQEQADNPHAIDQSLEVDNYIPTYGDTTEFDNLSVSGKTFHYDSQRIHDMKIELTRDVRTAMNYIDKSGTEYYFGRWKVFFNPAPWSCWVINCDGKRKGAVYTNNRIDLLLENGGYSRYVVGADDGHIAGTEEDTDGATNALKNHAWISDVRFYKNTKDEYFWSLKLDLTKLDNPSSAYYFMKQYIGSKYPDRKHRLYTYAYPIHQMPYWLSKMINIADGSANQPVN